VLEEEVRELTAHKDRAQSRVASLEEELGRVGGDLREDARNASIAAEQAKSELEARLARTDSMVEGLEMEVQRLQQERGALLEDQHALQQTLHELEGKDYPQRLGKAEKDRDEAVLKLRDLQDRMRVLLAMELGIRDAVAKLSHAQEAMEGLFTCINCLNFFTEPMLTSCGHTYCKGCIERTCQECHSTINELTCIPNALLDQLSGKFVYAQQVLVKLRDLQKG
jgi:hypothetical protein